MKKQGRLRRELSSPPHLTARPYANDYQSSLENTDEMKLSARDRSSNSIDKGSKKGPFELALANGDVRLAHMVAYSSGDNSTDGSGLQCLQCSDLQQQLCDLSRSIGVSCPSVSNVAAETIRVETKDSASDALHVETNDKRTSVSLLDRTEMRWHEDIGSSPIPQPRSYSIGIGTDREIPLKSRCCDASTDSPVRELKFLMKEVTIKILECGCGLDQPVVLCDFSCGTERTVLVETGTGSKQTPAFKDSSSMTSSVTSHSRPIQTEHVNCSTICVCTSPIQMVNRGVEAMRVFMRDSCTVCDEDLSSCSVLDAATATDHDLNAAETKQQYFHQDYYHYHQQQHHQQQQKTCNTVAVQTEFGMFCSFSVQFFRNCCTSVIILIRAHCAIFCCKRNSFVSLPHQCFC
ncbi:unnamed protein product [Gongylonema pulchrum]|uniref:Uncharacterized protein n=1 Tax=Gongylonema pulchrum TaxID=637853 RepID=A0A183EE31_9BILA|nr:unnamed protein product [Gongylonema pulchrum]